VIVVLAVLLGDPSSSKHDEGTPSTGVSGAALSAISVAPPPDDPAAASPCTTLLGALPINLNGLPSRPALSTSPYVVAWGQPPVVLRCGVARPKGLVPGASDELFGIDGVFFWTDHPKGATVFTSVDRAAYVEIRVPTTYGGGPVSPIASAIAKALPAVCVVEGAADPKTQCTHRS
jgi:hypothetical protein